MTFVPFNLRGREGGAMPEVAEGVSLRASNGGSSRSYIASTPKGQRGKGGGGIGPEETLVPCQSDPRTVLGLSENQRGELLETPYSHQLTSGGGKPGRGYGAVRVDAAVRRLTPIECERLQGLPDDWTNPTGDAPDSRRYAGLGDAVTSPVAEWIGRRILAWENAR